jgi:thiol-disulfide isomerase/thioredoxin
VHRLADYASSRLLAVVFISNHCPASQLYEGRIKALAADYASKGVKLVAIAPNGPDAASPHELNYTDVDDSMASMKIRAEWRKFNFDYLYDGATQAVAHQYGPKVTPHLYVFDQQRKLRFEGRIDDHLKESKAQTHEARDAIDALLAGKPVTVTHTAVFGCSTKWMSHAAAARDEMKEWQAQPVKLESASLADLQQLRKNPTGKYLLVNFWATWCAPCAREYPALLQTYLWYRSRDFDFVSVSVDDPAQRADVQKFLVKTHSAIRNLQVDTDNVYKVMAAFDQNWESGVPFTMVIAPDGSVVYQHAGEVDLLPLRRLLLARFSDAGYFAGNAQYWANGPR